MKSSMYFAPMVLLAASCQVGTPCETSAQCSNNEVCSQERCTYAFNRFYDVVVIQAEVPETDANGATWDEDQSGPDVYAEVGFSGESGGCYSQTVFETTTPFWEEVCSVWVPDHGTFLINLWEEDIGEEDPFIAGFYWEGAASFIEVLKADGNAVSATDEYDVATVQFTVWP